jgi:hypothetical protein
MLTCTSCMTAYSALVNIIAKAQYADMHFMYDICDGNSLAAFSWISTPVSVSEKTLLTCTWKMHRNVREACISWRMRLLAVEDAVCGMRGNVLDIVHGNHQPALVTFLLQQDDFFLEQHDILCVRMSCIRSMYSQCKFCSRGQTSLSWVLSMIATQDCVHTSISVPCRGMKWRGYAADFRVCDDLINRIRLTAKNIVHRTRTTISRQGFSLTSLWGVCLGEGKTLWIAVVVMYTKFSPLISPHHTNRKY